jgi:hypothetical protein
VRPFIFRLSAVDPLLQRWLAAVGKWAEARAVGNAMRCPWGVPVRAQLELSKASRACFKTVPAGIWKLSLSVFFPVRWRLGVSSSDH